MAAALLLAACGSANKTTTSTTTTTMSEAPLTTSWTTSNCSSVDASLQQSINGSISGCFRVPALNASSLVVSLQTVVSPSATVVTNPTTTIQTPVVGALTLSVSKGVVTPGEHLTVTGRYTTKGPPRGSDFDGVLCWDGCETGLQEEGSQPHWLSSTVFTMPFIVPGAPWFEGSIGRPSVHPLVSGDYSIGVECVVVSSGCANGPSDAQTTVRLVAPASTRCQSIATCGSLTLGDARAQVGDVVRVSGWAPLQMIIARPFGYNLSVLVASKQQQYGGIHFKSVGKDNDNAYIVTVDPTHLKVVSATTWSQLGPLHSLASTWSGAPTLNPLPGSSLIAWCRPTGVTITGGASTLNVPIAGLASTLAGTDLKLWGAAKPVPVCTTAVLDPRFPKTVYVGFEAAAHGEAPPVNMVGAYTTDDGAHWNRVPNPAGYTADDFAGFLTMGDRVEALFTTQYTYENSPIPTKPITVEEIGPDGIKWTTSTLSCPSTGPCATFGPYAPGNCAMNGSNQALLLASGEPRAGAVRWSTSTWVTTVNSCYSQQLVATSAHSLALLDPSSQYPLLTSTDSGRDWNYVQLPKLNGLNSNAINTWGKALVLDPNGSLFASISSSSGNQKKLFRLNPRATSWCQVPGVFSGKATAGITVSLSVNQWDLLWSQTNYSSSGAASTSIHLKAFSSLRC
jgi:hypothetical protein